MVVRIYLDTQHISRAADGRNSLGVYFSNPNCEFYFSASHVLECLPKDTTENLAAERRLKLIVSPTTRSLLPWGVVSDREFRSRISSIQDLVCAPRDMLFPDFVMNRAQWVKKARDGLDRVLKANVQDENMRRSFRAKFVKRGRLTDAAFSFLRSGAGKISKDTAEFPQALPLLEKGGLYDFLQGRVSEEAFRQTFLDTLCNPVALAGMSTMPDMDSILDISRIFWKLGDEMGEIVSRLILRLIAQQVNSQSFDFGRIKLEARKYLQSDEFVSTAAWKIAGLRVNRADLDRMPGTRLFVFAFVQYVLEKIDRHANIRSQAFGDLKNLKRSDIADLTHLFYCPYVDIFGCDGEMKNRLKSAGCSIENVVTSDAELEGRIRHMLAEPA